MFVYMRGFSREILNVRTQFNLETKMFLKSTCLFFIEEEFSGRRSFVNSKCSLDIEVGRSLAMVNIAFFFNIFFSTVNLLKAVWLYESDWKLSIRHIFWTIQAMAHFCLWTVFNNLWEEELNLRGWHAAMVILELRWRLAWV